MRTVAIFNSISIVKMESFTFSTGSEEIHKKRNCEIHESAMRRLIRREINKKGRTIADSAM